MARGLEEISHLFLSHQGRQDEAKNRKEKRFKADDVGNPRLPGDVAEENDIQDTLSKSLVQQNSCLFFCSNSLFVEKSVLACNLALELARRTFSVGIIETTTKLPTVFFLLGSLLSGSKKEERPSSVIEKLLSLPSTIPPPEPLKLVHILHRYPGAVRAVFFERDLDSDSSLAMLNKLHRQYNFLIVNAPADILQVSKMIAFVNPYFIVSSTAHPDELINSYLLIKQISQTASCSGVGHLIVGESCHARAEAASNVIAEMARKFLTTEVRFMGMIPKGDDFSQSILTRTPFLLHKPNASASLGIRQLADLLIEHVITWR